MAFDTDLVVLFGINSWGFNISKHGDLPRSDTKYGTNHFFVSVPMENFTKTGLGTNTIMALCRVLQEELGRTRWLVAQKQLLRCQKHHTTINGKDIFVQNTWQITSSLWLGEKKRVVYGTPSFVTKSATSTLTPFRESSWGTNADQAFQAILIFGVARLHLTCGSAFGLPSSARQVITCWGRIFNLENIPKSRSHLSSVVATHMGVSKNRGTPSYHPF